jgi:hypothetical protein
MKSFVVPIVAAVSLMAASTTANAALIANGSFETPTVPVGNFTNFTVGTATLTGWTVFGPAGLKVSIVSGTFMQNGVTAEAEDGVQWLDLTGDGSNSTEGVSQAVTTTIGDQYQLSYFVGNTSGGGIFGTTRTVIVLVNGVPTFTDTNSNCDLIGLNWGQVYPYLRRHRDIDDIGVSERRPVKQ